MKVSTNIIAPLVAAASLASGFVVEMFTEKGCGGNSLGERNVWDNSCGKFPAQCPLLHRSSYLGHTTSLFS